MARYDGLRKIERNEALRKYAKAHPDLSLKEIGQVFNISGARVWRIIHGNQPKVS
jgi:DNA-directed RNA polymerase specialized sigma subunit